MTLELGNILYTVLGGVSMLAVTKTLVSIRHHMTGRNAIVKYSTFIKRHARNRREIENLLCESKHLHSIVMQGIDAAYIAVAGKEPLVTVLYLGKNEDAQLFRSCLDHMNDPETIYALGARHKPSKNAKKKNCSECAQFSSDAIRGGIEDTWFRFTQGRDITDEKVDDAMLEQVITLAKSRDTNISQSGSCHIPVKMQDRKKLDNIVVIPTSMAFRKYFRKEFGTDDLTRFGAKDLFDKIIRIRHKMSAA